MTKEEASAVFQLAEMASVVALLARQKSRLMQAALGHDLWDRLLSASEDYDMVGGVTLLARDFPFEPDPDRATA